MTSRTGCVLLLFLLSAFLSPPAAAEEQHGLTVEVPRAIEWPGAAPPALPREEPEVLYAVELPTRASQSLRLRLEGVVLGPAGVLLVSGGGGELLVYSEEDLGPGGTLETAALPGGSPVVVEVVSVAPEGGEAFRLRSIVYHFADPASEEAIAAQVEAGFGAGRLGSAIEWDGPDRKVIYGTDSRVEIEEVRDQQLRAMAESVALVTNISQLSSVEGGWSLNRVPWTSTGLGQLCPDERFRGQPSGVGGDCTGFLIAPDLFITAGHCISTASCQNRAFVFGYRMNADGSEPDLFFGQDDVYFCDGIEAREFGGGRDWAVVRLDRAVEGRQGLPYRHGGEIAEETPLAMIGHPVALPMKMASDATVTSPAGSSPYFFQANLDAYGGNSGSPVINLQTGIVEGLLVRGLADFRVRQGESCVESNVVPHTGGSGALDFEEVSRTTDFAPDVPLPPPQIPPEARVVGDFDYDGCTGFRDFLFLLEKWGVEIDGVPIGFEDFTNLLENWGFGC